MGGYGSTRWANTRTRHYIGECLTLDLARIGRAVRSGRGISTWTWPRSTGAQPSIRMHIAEDAVVLMYATQSGAGAARSIRDTVTLDRTPCTRGGDRLWFRCSGCDRRVRALHLPPGADHFRCRHCHNLAYGSQQVAPDERHLMAIRTIQRRLGGDPRHMSPWMLPPKPKGMHWRTYERLRHALFEHEMEREEILVAQMRRFLARSERLFGTPALRSAR